MSTWLKIAQGRVVDPANVVDEVRDLWVSDGRIVAAPGDDVRPSRTIDARGDVVMPGGVDVHCHLAGPKINAARVVRPEEARRGSVPRRPGFRSGTLGSVPSSFATAYGYAGLGYTTALDAAVPPLGARHVHHEFRDTPILDKAFLVLLGNNHYAMDRVREADNDRLRSYMAWMLEATRAYGIKVVNPGGIERWKEGRGNVVTLDDTVEGFGVTPRQILSSIARAVDELALPHPVHVHGLNLGLPGNWKTTLETMKALDGHRAHLAHIQFHSYGGGLEESVTFDSKVAPLVDQFLMQPHLTADIGQVTFGETTSLTADGPVGQYLQRVTGRKWFSHDVEHETGCGVVPITYEDKNYVHALQWAIGLEWFLRVDNPWRIALSTDHPNGGPFLAYPEIIALLMDRGLRQETLAKLPERVRARSGLADLAREYSLAEVATVTRAAPARMMGLSNKGHLGIGADADITIYRPDADKRRMFASPRYLIKGGAIVLDDGELRQAPDGATLSVRRLYDEAEKAAIAEWFDASASFRFRNFAVSGEEVIGERVIDG
jgi:formylmethanofuran dehydrogenase subunit A